MRLPPRIDGGGCSSETRIACRLRVLQWDVDARGQTVALLDVQILNCRDCLAVPHPVLLGISVGSTQCALGVDGVSRILATLVCPQT